MVWSLIATWPLVLHLGDAIYGYPGDALGTISDFWWFAYALHHGAPLLYNELRGVPLGSGWETVYFDVLQVGLFAPLSYAVGPIAAYNAGMLSSYPLTAWVTFLLGRRLGMNNLAAAFAGLTYAFVPFHQEKAMVHLLHTHMELFTAFLYFGVRWRQSGSRWSLVGAGAITGLTLWTDPSLSYLLAVVIAVFFITSIVWRPHERTWTQQLRAHVVGAVAVLVVTALFVPAVLAVSTRAGAQHSGSIGGQFTSTERLSTELVTYAARTKEYLLPWHLNPLIPSSLRAYEEANRHGSSFAEMSLTIGYTVIALSIAGLLAFRRTYAAWLCVVIAVAGFVMSQPPEHVILGITIPMPSHFLFPVLPIFRVYSRFGILVLLGAALLAGFGFMALDAKLAASRRWLLALPFLLVAAEFNGVPPSHVLELLPAPAEYTWLKAQPPGTLIEYPLAIRSPDPQVGTDVEVANRVYAFYQQVHEHAMFNGATSDSAAARLAYTLDPYYLPGVAAELRSLDIRYVFVHRAAYVRFGRDPTQPVPGYRFVETLDDTDIWVAPTS